MSLIYLEESLIYDMMVEVQFHIFPCGYQIFKHYLMNSSFLSMIFNATGALQQAFRGVGVSL